MREAQRAIPVALHEPEYFLAPDAVLGHHAVENSDWMRRAEVADLPQATAHRRDFLEFAGRIVTGSASEFTSTDVSFASHPDVPGVLRLDPESKQAYELGISRSLQEVRRQISLLDNTQQDMLHRHLDAAAAPEIVQAKQKSDPALGVYWPDWLLSTTDADLLGFLRWNADTIRDMQQDPTVKLFTEIQKQRYHIGMRRAVRSGWISTAAIEDLDRIDGVQVKLGDFFHMELQRTAGHYIAGSQHVVVAKGTGVKWPVKPTTMRHEFGHYLFLGKPGKLLQASWVHEALTEHVTQSLMYGKPNVVNPMWGKAGSYVSERELLDTLLRYGKRQIEPAVATRAYSGTLREKFDFYQALMNAWGGDVLSWTNDTVARETTHRLTKGQSFFDAQSQACQRVILNLKNSNQSVIGIE